MDSFAVTGVFRNPWDFYCSSRVPAAMALELDFERPIQSRKPVVRLTWSPSYASLAHLDRRILQHALQQSTASARRFFSSLFAFCSPRYVHIRFRLNSIVPSLSSLSVCCKSYVRSQFCSLMSHGAPKKRHEEDEDCSEGPPPPDGGWGWAVTFGSFMIHIVSKQICLFTYTKVHLGLQTFNGSLDTNVSDRKQKICP